MKDAASIVDFDAADRAAERIVLAYELADILNDFSEDKPGLVEPALNVALVVAAFGLVDIDVTERKALSQFGKIFRRVRQAAKKIGKDARLRDVITELHLDQGKDR